MLVQMVLTQQPAEAEALVDLSMELLMSLRDKYFRIILDLLALEVQEG